MTKDEKIRLRLALSIISGRQPAENISEEDYSTLGYDLYHLRELGNPSADEVKCQCENILFDIITELI